MDHNNPIGRLDLNQLADGDAYMEDQGAKLQGRKTKLYYGCKNETSSG
jgi:hypothetical protein